MLDAVAARGEIENVWLFFLAVFWNNSRYGEADNLFRGIAIEMLGTLVPGSHDAAEIGTEDSILARLDDRGQPLQRLGAALPFRHIMRDADEQARPADSGFPDRQIHGNRGAVLAPARDLAADA